MNIFKESKIMLKQIFRKATGALAMIAVLILASVMPAFAGQYSHPSGWGVLYGLGGSFAFGMLINTANLQALFTTYKTIFNKAYSAVTPQYQNVAIDVNSTALVEVHGWIDEMPGMREWKGDRVIHGMKAEEWAIKNVPYELTVSVPRRNIEADSYGLYAPRFQFLGGSGAAKPDVLVFGLLPGGFTNKCFDGKAFYAANHRFGSNLLTDVLSTTSFDKAMATLLGWKKADGSPFFDGSETFTLVVGPQLRGAGRRIVVAKTVVADSGNAAIDNLNEGAAKLLVTPQITSATQWFITVEKWGFKPLIFQARKRPQFVGLENPTDPNVFMRGEFVYGIDADWNASYTLPWLSIGSTGLGS